MTPREVHAEFARRYAAFSDARRALDSFQDEFVDEDEWRDSDLAQQLIRLDAEFGTLAGFILMRRTVWSELPMREALRRRRAILDGA